MASVWPVKDGKYAFRRLARREAGQQGLGGSQFVSWKRANELRAAEGESHEFWYAR